MKGVFLKEGKVVMRPPEAKDLKGEWYAWLNDPVVTRYQNKGIIPNTRAKQAEYFREMTRSRTDVIFAIVDDKSGRHIGSAGLHKIDWIHRNAELGIVIGDKKFWGKGIGRTSWRLLTRYGFERLNLHRISAVIFERNIPSIRAAEASGFRKEGIMKDLFFKDGAYHSAFMMAVLDKDFKRIMSKENI